MVDCRSKQWGLTHRKNFNNEKDAIEYSQKVDADIKANGQAIANNLIYQDKDVAKWNVVLKVHGKTIDDAVGFYVRHIEEEIKKAVIPTI